MGGRAIRAIRAWGRCILAAGFLAGGGGPCEGAGTTAVRFINASPAEVSLAYEGVEGTRRGPHAATLLASVDGGAPFRMVERGEAVRVRDLRLRPGGTVTLVMDFREEEGEAVSDNFQFLIRQEGREGGFQIIHTAMELRTPGEAPLREATLELHASRFFRDALGKWQILPDQAPPLLQALEDPVRLVFQGYPE